MSAGRLNVMVIGVAFLLDAACSFQGVAHPYYANIQNHESNELPVTAAYRLRVYTLAVYT
jgi:hypothetical protein